MATAPQPPERRDGSMRSRARGARLQAGGFWSALDQDLRKGRRRRAPATGLRIRGNVVEWATLCEGKRGLETLSAGRVALEGDAAVLADPAQLAEAIRRQCPGVSGTVSFGLASGQMLLRVVDLPSTDPDEMAGMIKLQLDKFSPFPEERMAFSYEVLQAAGGGCRALIAAVQKDTLDAAGTVCRQAGFALRRIDADLMGWWRLLADQGAMPAAGRHLVLRLEEEGGILLAVQDGSLAAVKTIGARGGLPEEEYAGELAHELGAFILVLDLEQGVAPVSGLDLWRQGPAPPALLERLRTELGQAPRERDLGAMPALSEGLARRMLAPPFEAASAPGRGAAAVLDLVPAVWRSAEDSLRVKRRLIAASILVAGIWLALVLGLVAIYTAQQRGLETTERRLAEVQKPADEVRAMQRRARAFEQYLDRRQSALECLREVSRLLPEGITLAAFQFKKAKSVILRGEALTVNPIYDFKQELDKSPLFSRVDMGSIQPGKRKTETVQTFQMTLHLPEEQP